MTINHYNFIEIGTSNFDTYIQNEENEKGISIEPIKRYLDKLPDIQNVIKLNCCISNVNSIANVFYIPEERFEKYKLKDWAKGCNSINEYHPTILNWLLKNNFNPEEAFIKNTVPVYTLSHIINKYKITSIDKLKIDTEGHDTFILDHYFDNCDILAEYIKFECNELTDNSKIEHTIEKARKLGYYILKRDKEDCILQMI